MTKIVLAYIQVSAVKKRHKDKGLTVATNTGDILTAINNHAFFTPVDKPNQTHAEYTTYDISCNEDFALHAKHHQWEKIFEFFHWLFLVHPKKDLFRSMINKEAFPSHSMVIH